MKEENYLQGRTIRLTAYFPIETIKARIAFKNVTFGQTKREFIINRPTLMIRLKDVLQAEGKWFQIASPRCKKEWREK